MRAAAIVLPDLLCELAARGAVQALSSPEKGSSQKAADAPFVVVLDEGVSLDAVVDAGAARVAAASRAARAAGVRVGQRVSEAHAVLAGLAVLRLPARAIGEALAAVAEVALGFGATVALALDGGIAPGDVVWVDVAGVAHLFGGEEALARELTQRVEAVGHRARVAIAAGPCLAEALARAGRPPLGRSERGPGAPLDEASFPHLPAAALFSLAGRADEAMTLFGRLGVITVGDLARLERAQLLARLGSVVGAGARGAIGAKEIVGWLQGFDGRRLAPWSPPAVLVEEVAFDDGVETAAQLLFVLRGMASRLASRLAARGEAANHLALVVHHDAAIHRLRGLDGPPRLDVVIELPAPLSHEGDLVRTLKAKLESLELEAPAVRVELVLSRIVHAPEVQLDLSRDGAVSPDALPALLAELSAEIGPERVGVLLPRSDHRPELQSELTEPLDRRAAAPVGASVRPEPTRVLSRPLPLHVASAPGGRAQGSAGLAPGDVIFVGPDGLSVLDVAFDRRLDGVTWWTRDPQSRDYYRVRVLVGSAPRAQTEHEAPTQSVAEAWIYRDRNTGALYLGGYWE